MKFPNICSNLSSFRRIRNFLFISLINYMFASFLHFLVSQTEDCDNKRKKERVEVKIWRQTWRKENCLSAFAFKISLFFFSLWAEVGFCFLCVCFPEKYFSFSWKMSFVIHRARNEVWIFLDAKEVEREKGSRLGEIWPLNSAC